MNFWLQGLKYLRHIYLNLCISADVGRGVIFNYFIDNSEVLDYRKIIIDKLYILIFVTIY